MAEFTNDKTNIPAGLFSAGSIPALTIDWRTAEPQPRGVTLGIAVRDGLQAPVRVTRLKGGKSHVETLSDYMEPAELKHWLAKRIESARAALRNAEVL